MVFLRIASKEDKLRFKANWELKSGFKVKCANYQLYLQFANISAEMDYCIFSILFRYKLSWFKKLYANMWYTLTNTSGNALK